MCHCFECQRRGCVIFGILRKVTIVSPYLCELPNDPWPLNLQSMPKLVFEHRMTLRSHRDFSIGLKADFP